MLIKHRWNARGTDGKRYVIRAIAAHDDALSYETEDGDRAIAITKTRYLVPRTGVVLIREKTPREASPGAGAPQSRAAD